MLRHLAGGRLSGLCCCGRRRQVGLAHAPKRSERRRHSARAACSTCAWTTNVHVYSVRLGEGLLPAAPVCLTEANAGYDLEPLFSPDGRYLLWCELGLARSRRSLLLFARTAAHQAL